MGSRATRRYTRQPHLWLRPDTGYWFIVWSDSGTKHRDPTGTRKRAVAEEALRTFLEENAGRANWRSARSLGFREAAREWAEMKQQERYGLTKATINEYRLTAERLEKLVPKGMTVGEVTSRDLRQILDRYEKRWKASSRSLRRVQGHLSMLFLWLQREGVVSRNPAAGLEPVKREPREQHCVSAEEFAELRRVLEGEVAAGDTPSIRRQAQDVLDLVDMLWVSGLRSIEAYRLEWTDLDLKTATWRIRSPENKGGTRRQPMHRTAVGVLSRRQLQRLESPFPKFVTQNAWIRFKKRQPAFEGWSLHGLRRGFISRLVAAGNLAAARHLGRHRTPAMTDLYTTVSVETFREALEAL